MKILLAIIFSSIVLNCTQNLGMEKNQYSNQEQQEKQNDNYILDRFGDYLEFEEEENIINFLDSISNKQKVFSTLHLNEEGNHEGLIHYAVDSGNLNVLKKIIENVNDKKALVNLKTSVGEVPLNLAIVRGDLEIADYLIKEGANINYVNINNGVSVFHRAAQSESEEVVKYILEQHAKLGPSGLNLASLKTKDNSTLLHWAVLFDIKLLSNSLLIDANQKFLNEKGGRFKLTALDLAKRLERDELFELINNKTKALAEVKE